MIHNEENIDTVINAYLSVPKTRWVLGNKVLYDLCRDHPGHSNSDEIVAKIWLIGRSYAAAVERRKNADSFDGDFYYDSVAPALISIGHELDCRLQELNTYSGIDDKTLDSVLDAHGLLVKVFSELTGMDKRSLASKYLHFHCPNVFFIYDSRANTSIRRFVRKGRDNLNKHISAGRDMEYIDFCVRALELKDYIRSKYGCVLSPRELDDLLLYYMK